ncbi:MAG TPA: hypothetical protein VFL82_08695, partial [Thermomicrobiales bacterium]|nr:hypothetical protein [Thermomicrobiales bacterium]
ITALVLLGHGVSSQLYIFYIPALLALSLVFPTEWTITFAGIVLTTYGLIGLYGIFPDRADDMPVLITRLLMFAAVAFCGNLYWRIEHEWRADAAPVPAPQSATGAEQSAEDGRTLRELPT